jgi:hypothetical protein
MEIIYYLRQASFCLIVLFALGAYAISFSRFWRVRQRRSILRTSGYQWRETDDLIDRRVAWAFLGIALFLSVYLIVGLYDGAPVPWQTR